MDKEVPRAKHLQLPLMPKDKEKEEKSEVESRYGTKRNKILFTVFIYLVYIFHGMNNNLLGPSLIDLEYLTNSTTSSITAVFTWKNGGYFLGTAISGPIVDRVNESFIIGVALCLTATATFLIPTWKHLIGLFITTGGAGIAIAFNSVCTSATILAVWGQDAKPYQQALHFFVTIGAAITPQLIKPFLRTRDNDIAAGSNNEINNLTSESVNETYALSRNRSNLLMSGTVFTDSHIHYCYIIIASCLMVLSASSFTIFICNGCRLWKMTPKKRSSEGEKSLISGKARVIVLIFLFFQSFMYGGIEEVFAGLTMTFVVKYLKMSKAMASDVSTVFMAMTATSRGAGVILSKLIRPSRLLAIQLVILLSGTLVLAFAVHLHWIVPWIGFAAAGLGTGSLFPTLINWAHGYMTVKGKETAILFTGGAFTGMTVPPLIGFLFEWLDPMWFVYITLILVVLFIILFLFNLLFVHASQREDQDDCGEDNEIKEY